MNAHSDRADRVLAAAVALLPKGHQEWGAAMRAELAVITGAGARWRYSASCVRAICVTPHAIGGLLSRACVGVLAVLAVAFSTQAAPGVAIQATVLLLVLGWLSVAGLRDSRFGPVGDSAVARCWRMAGYLLVATLLLWLLQPRDGGPTHDPSGFWVAGAMITILLAATLQLTSSARPRTLLIVAAAALVTAGVWEALLLLFSQVRAAPTWAGILVAAAGLLAAGARRLRGSSEESALAAVAAVFASGMLIFIAVGTTYRAAPQLAPDVAGSSPAGGLTAADRRETNRNEAMDPYVAIMLAAAVAGLVVVGIRGGRGIAAAGATPQLIDSSKP